MELLETKGTVSENFRLDTEGKRSEKLKAQQLTITKYRVEKQGRRRA